MLRDSLLLVSRSVVGGYVAAHGAQKLFGSFGGHGLEGTGGFFESVGLQPGKAMAAAAGVSELSGGTLTAAGLANPVGPAVVASTMAVAAGTVHTGSGAFAASNGPELPLANLAACLALAAAGPGRFSIDRTARAMMPPGTGAVVFAAGGAVAAAVIGWAQVKSPADETDQEKAGAGASPETEAG
jgi:putative oxidoreductase